MIMDKEHEEETVKIKHFSKWYVCFNQMENKIFFFVILVVVMIWISSILKIMNSVSVFL
jgi:hypothetical protein